MNDNTQTKPAGITATDLLNQQAAEIAEIAEARERNQKLASEAMRLDAELTERTQHLNRLVERCETADPEVLAVRVHDQHRLNFLIHHAASITIGDTVL